MGQKLSIKTKRTDGSHENKKAIPKNQGGEASLVTSHNEGKLHEYWIRSQLVF